MGRKLDLGSNGEAALIYAIGFEDALKRLQSELKGIEERAPAALRNAINSSMTETKKRLQSYIAERYTLQDDTLFTKALRQKRSSPQNPNGRLLFRGEALDLYKYDTKWSKGQAVTARVYSSSSLKQINIPTKSFIATMDSGHTGVFQRVPGEMYTEQKYIDRRIEKYRKKNREKDPRIRKAIGPSIPGIVHTVYEDEKDEFVTMFEKHVQQQIVKQMKKYGGKP